MDSQNRLRTGLYVGLSHFPSVIKTDEKRIAYGIIIRRSPVQVRLSLPLFYPKTTRVLPAEMLAKSLFSLINPHFDYGAMDTRSRVQFTRDPLLCFAVFLRFLRAFDDTMMTPFSVPFAGAQGLSQDSMRLRPAILRRYAGASSCRRAATDSARSLPNLNLTKTNRKKGPTGVDPKKLTHELHADTPAYHSETQLQSCVGGSRCQFLSTRSTTSVRSISTTSSRTRQNSQGTRGFKRPKQTSNRFGRSFLISKY